MEAINILTIFCLGAFAPWMAVLTGIALNLNPWATFFTSSLGAIAGVIIILILGEPARHWLLKKYMKENNSLRKGRIYYIWKKYNIMGIGLIAPTLVGAPLGTVIGIALGAPTGRLLFWMSVGIIIYNGLLTLAIVWAIL